MSKSMPGSDGSLNVRMAQMLGGQNYVKFAPLIALQNYRARFAYSAVKRPVATSACLSNIPAAGWLVNFIQSDVSFLVVGLCHSQEFVRRNRSEAFRRTVFATTAGFACSILSERNSF
jgi:hypothetical protein